MDFPFFPLGALLNVTFQAVRLQWSQRLRQTGCLEHSVAVYWNHDLQHKSFKISLLRPVWTHPSVNWFCLIENGSVLWSSLGRKLRGRKAKQSKTRMHSQHHRAAPLPVENTLTASWQSVLSSCWLTEKEEWSSGFSYRTRISPLRILFLAMPQASLWSQMTTSPSSSPCLEWGQAYLLASVSLES